MESMFSWFELQTIRILPSSICGVLGYPKGSALELLDGTLKLRHCTDLFTKRFSLGLYPGLVLGLVRGIVLLLVILQILVVIVVKGSALPRRLVQEQLLMSFRIQIQGHSTSRRWKRLRSPSSEGEGSEVGVPRNLFPRLGVG